MYAKVKYLTSYEDILDFNQVVYTLSDNLLEFLLGIALTLEREFDDYVTIRRLNQWYL